MSNQLPIYDVIDDNLIVYMMQFLDDVSKRKFISTCKFLLKLQSRIYYDDEIYIYNKVQHLSYSEFFKRLYYYAGIISSNINFIPQNIEYLQIYRDVSIEDLFEKNVGKLDSIKYLDFDEIDAGKINKLKNNPNSIKTLFVNNEQNLLNLLIPSINKLYIHYHSNLDLNLSFFKLTHITFHCGFNKSTDFMFPETLEYLDLGDKFNTPLTPNSLPKNLKHLYLGYEYNYPIENCLPYGLKHLILGHLFTQKIKNAIPETVTHLCIGGRFYRKVRGYLPKNLIHLELGWGFNKPLLGEIPNVEYLKTGSSFEYPICDDSNPSKITHLIMGSKINKSDYVLPQSLKTLVLDLHYDDPTILFKIPNSVTNLVIANSTSIDLGLLDSNCCNHITHLTLNKFAKGSLKNLHNIDTLILDQYFSTSLHNLLPHNLKHLYIENEFYKKQKQFIESNISVHIYKSDWFDETEDKFLSKFWYGDSKYDFIDEIIQHHKKYNKFIQKPPVESIIPIKQNSSYDCGLYCPFSKDY
ncbi:hypothetical protein [Niemeyer virus]|uniref:FNIP repeat-containing protein n=1 Tax=Acanthamoeba polyphaga mimivirus Kroon TaxID=3069720 RepID=A0A0G2Y5N5_9VIRU|nr:putative FNIP repeat-containing protein [Acanthamoeba polyphaga mimivirus]AKI79894.1 putative FNIP repeat-containing protein [Acanthamoeba polyphaga mimivirus Kroon]ALR83727.1 hypothetical protein [Niemeyer virus]